MAKLGTEANSVTTNPSFVSSFSNTLTSGIGNLVGADVAAESATLQTKQQLGVQALSIANFSSAKRPSCLVSSEAKRPDGDAGGPGVISGRFAVLHLLG